MKFHWRKDLCVPKTELNPLTKHCSAKHEKVSNNHDSGQNVS